MNGRNTLNVDVQPMDVDIPDSDNFDTPDIPLSPRAGSSTVPQLVPEPTPPPPQLTQAGRPKRNYQQPARYIDVNPEPLRSLDEEPRIPTAVLRCVTLIVRNRLRTAMNSFNLLREYLYRPSFDPDSFVPTEDLLNSHNSTDTAPLRPLTLPPVHRNETVELLMNWKDSGPSTKSDGEVNRLVNEVLLDPNFKLEDLRGFSAAQENRRMDAAVRWGDAMKDSKAQLSPVVVKDCVYYL
jgi:hypothetical protein